MLGLADAVDYHYLDQSDVIEVEGINDEKDNSMVTKKSCAATHSRARGGMHGRRRRVRRASAEVTTARVMCTPSQSET